MTSARTMLWVEMTPLRTTSLASYPTFPHDAERLGTRLQLHLRMVEQTALCHSLRYVNSSADSVAQQIICNAGCLKSVEDTSMHRTGYESTNALPPVT